MSIIDIILYVFRKNFILLFFCTGKNEEMISAKMLLTVAGDGRHDSMGHSAKYCAYTTFCCPIPKNYPLFTCTGTVGHYINGV